MIFDDELPKLIIIFTIDGVGVAAVSILDKEHQLSYRVTFQLGIFLNVVIVLIFLITLGCSKVTGYFIVTELL